MGDCGSGHWGKEAAAEGARSTLKGRGTCEYWVVNIGVLCGDGALCDQDTTSFQEGEEGPLAGCCVFRGGLKVQVGGGELRPGGGGPWPVRVGPPGLGVGLGEQAKVVKVSWGGRKL